MDFLSTFSAGPRVTLEPWLGKQCAYRIAVQLPMELSRGDLSLAGVCRMAPVLRQCVGSYSLVLAWIFFSLVVVRVNSVLMGGWIFSSCGIQDSL